MSEIKYFIPLIKIILLILFFLIIHIDKMIHINGDKNMKYKVSDECIAVLKELSKEKGFKPLKDKKDIEEILLALTFILAMVNLAKNKDNNAKLSEELIKKCGNELKENLDNIDIEYINYKLSK